MYTSRLRLIVILFVFGLVSRGSARGSVVVTNPYHGVTRIVRTETSPRSENMNMLEIDLADPGIHFKLSPANPPLPNTFNNETSVQTTLAFLNQEHAQLAVNVHFFDNPAQPNGGTNLTGLAASNGNVFSAFDPSPVLNYAILPNAPVVNLGADSHATMAFRGATDTSLVNAIGDPVTPYNSLSGSAQIITNGAVSLPVGLPPRPGSNPPVFFYTDQIAARTAVGLSQDGNTLFLFTVDANAGRLGMTISEMANLLQTDYGVYNALNLDGGGSTTVAMLDPVTQIASVVHGASAGQRAVGTSLAIFADPVPEPAVAGLILSGLVIAILRRQRGSAVLLLASGVLLYGFTGSTSAAVIPYSQDFESIAGGGSLSGATIGSATAATNPWAVAVDSGGNHLYQNTLGATGTSSAKGFSTLQFTNLGPADPGHSFEVSTVVSPISASLGGTVNYTAGLILLENSASSTDNSYLADLNIGVNGGRIRVVEFTGSTATVLPSPTQSLQPLVPGFNVGKSYLLDVLGTYDLSNALTLKFTVTEVGAPLNTMSYTAPVDASPRTGSNFGFYDSIGSGGGTMVVNYDNFVAVPEPQWLALLPIGSLVAYVAGARRRSVQS